jgi:CO/xanthine dehydrogenase FAD-binding subunit
MENSEFLKKGERNVNNVVYFSPNTLQEALAMLGNQDEAKILAGGTDLIAKWKKSLRFDMKLVYIKKIPELRIINESGEGLFIGSAVTMDDINDSKIISQKFPILAEACGKVGSVQIRNMATIGGNCCNAAPSADTALPLMVYSANTVIASKSGERKCPIHEFFESPGKTILQKCELLKGFMIPYQSPGSYSFFVKHSRRAGMDLATVGVAMLLVIDEKKMKVKGIKVALGAVGPTPILVKGLEEAIGKTMDDEFISFISEQSTKEGSPITDVRGSKGYRERMIRENVTVCCKEIIKKLAFREQK